MKKFKFKITSGLFALVIISHFATMAQKLSDVQERGLLAPANVKIDGKPTEWGAAYQAYNKATLVYYTIANDSKNLYLVIHSTDKTVSNKIMRGGITFNISRSGKKKDKNGPTVTFPVVGSTDARTLMQGMRGGGQSGSIRVEMGQMNPDEMVKRADSVMAEANKKQIAALKEIKVFGLKGITDSLISIYNEYGVKAMASFDAKGAFTYELALPLDMIGLATGSQKEFFYNVQLNGLQLNGIQIATGIPAGAGGGNTERVIITSGGAGGGNINRTISDMMSMLSPTDFWGKYILAKK